MTEQDKKDVAEFLGNKDKRSLYHCSKDLKLLATETGKGNVLSEGDLMFGICNAIPDSNIVCVLSLYWLEFSGKIAYPVPHPTGARTGFDNSDNLWIGEYGAARKRLCLWLAETIDNFLIKIGVEDVQ